jgi:integrase
MEVLSRIQPGHISKPTLYKVIIFVLLDTLVRISELVSIKSSNVDLKGGFIHLEVD